MREDRLITCLLFLESSDCGGTTTTALWVIIQDRYAWTLTAGGRGEGRRTQSCGAARAAPRTTRSGKRGSAGEGKGRRRPILVKNVKIQDGDQIQDGRPRKSKTLNILGTHFKFRADRNSGSQVMHVWRNPRWPTSKTRWRPNLNRPYIILFQNSVSHVLWPSFLCPPPHDASTTA